MNCGLQNKGNSCYINASLQNFSSMIELWSNFSLHSDTLSLFVLSFVQTVSMLRSSKTVSVSLNFCVVYRVMLLSLENVILIYFNSRMQIRLCLACWKNCVELPHVQDMLRTAWKNQVSCNNCFEILLNDKPTSMFHLSVTKSLQTSLNIFLKSEELTEPDSFFL